ncbi:MAG: hypothetical protein IKT31_02715, partial [Firmicutes bacterium]|nr:hypothetical protein [Bacillota bacterium]
MEKKASVLPGTRLYTKFDRGQNRYYITTPDNPEKTYIGWKNNPDLLRQLLDREKARKHVLRVRENMEILERLM